jgi:hypothetical protein
MLIGDIMIVSILAFLFIAMLCFVYFETKLYIGVIKHLTKVLSELKAFSMGNPLSTDLERPYKNPLIPDGHPDFGLGEIIRESDDSIKPAKEEEIL